MKVGDLLGRYKPAEKSVRLLLDGSIRSRIDEASQRLKQARRTEKVDGLSSRVNLIEKELLELNEEADEATATVTLTALPGAVFSSLVQAHQANEDDWQAFREIQKQNPLFARAPEYHVESFAPALIGLSISSIDGEDVDWDEDDGLQLWESLSDGARADLWDAALTVNLGRSSRPLSETATGTTENTGGGSTTSATEESPSLRLAEGS